MFLLGNETRFISKEDISFLPKILYKYRTWSKEKHKRLLTNCEIHFSPPNKLDENTECVLERDYGSVTETMILEFCLNKAWTEVYNGEIKLVDLVDRTRHLYAFNDFHDLSLRPSKEQFFKDLINESISIFCSSETPLNERLWNSFASYKKGYCVGIDFTEIYLDHDKFGMCGKVDYYDELNPPMVPAITLSGEDGVRKMLQLIYNLPDRFEEEKEFRLHKSHMISKTIPLKPEWIKEVILGSEMSKTDEEEVVSIVKEKYPHALIKKLFVEPTYGVLTIVDFK